MLEKLSAVGCLNGYSALCDAGANLVQAGKLKANEVPGQIDQVVTM